MNMIYYILFIIDLKSTSSTNLVQIFKYDDSNLRKILKLQIDINRIRTTTTTTTTKDKIDYKTNQIIQYSNKILN